MFSEGSLILADYVTFVPFFSLIEISLNSENEITRVDCCEGFWRSDNSSALFSGPCLKIERLEI